MIDFTLGEMLGGEPVHSESDASYRERILRIAREEDRTAIHVVIGFSLDAIGLRYGLIRDGLASEGE